MQLRSMAIGDRRDAKTRCWNIVVFVTLLKYSGIISIIQSLGARY